MFTMAERPSQVVPDADPLVACIGHVARHFGMSFVPGMLSGLARDVDGRLPWHQVEQSLELIGLNCESLSKDELPSVASAYPAIVGLTGGRSVIVSEIREGDALVWRPDTAESRWEPLADVQADYAGWMVTVFGDPNSLRDASEPWSVQARGHWFWSEMSKIRRKFAPVLLASLLINLLALALPLFSMNVYDRVLPNRAAATLWVLAIGVLTAFALDYVLRRARTNVIDQLGRELDIKLSQKIFSKILATPLASRKGHTGNVVARVSEFAIVRDFFASTTIVLVVDMAFLVLFIALIAYIAGWLALVPIAAAAIMGMLGLRLQRKVIDAARDAQADHGLQQTLLVESVAGVETLKSIGGEGVMLGRWRRLAEIGSQSQQRLKDISSSAIGMAQTCQQAANIALIVGGYYLFDAGRITMGAIIAIVMLSTRSLSPAAQLAFVLTRGQQASQTLESLQKLWEETDERRRGSASVVPSIRSARIRLDSLDFTYPDSTAASLDRIELDIHPGDRIAVIGRVASGKSTLGRILCGLYEPTGGSMLIDGIDSRQYRPQDLRASFRYVGQDSALFSGTMKDNLTLGAGAATDEDLIEALRRVGADEFLARDSGGFDRGVGESGVWLSGGQRSFLTLARAFVRPCRLLFLDEPTGAMDNQTEKLFVERLSQSLTPDQTLVISTHRPALFSVCNRLIVLDKGKIVADGPRDQIIASAGLGTKP